MKEVCLVPTFQRSAMLHVCLEAIRAADPLISVHCFPDRGTNESEVCAKFDAAHHLTVNHNYHGNTFNMMEALKWAHSQHYDLVHIIEDDSIIAPTYFDWARGALERKPDLFAACGWQYSPDALPPYDGADILIPWYLSVCACLPARSVYALQQHAKPEYYSNMKGYLNALYPNSVHFGTNHYEQDGMALRTAVAQSRVCAWPSRPRATHIGWYGYHMGDNKLPGTLNDQIAIIKLVLENPTLLKGMMGGSTPPEIDRCFTCNKPLLSNDKNARVQCVECFHAANPGRLRTSGSQYYFSKPRVA